MNVLARVYMLGPGRDFGLFCFRTWGNFCCAVACMWDPGSFLVCSTFLPMKTWGKERTRVESGELL